MKVLRIIFLAAAVVATAIVPAWAQQQPQPGRPAAPAASGGGNAEGKIVIIYTEVFDDEKQGIARLVSAIKGVDREFEPRRTELQTLQQRYQQLIDELNKTAAVQDPRAQQQKREQAEQLQREIERKREDAQIAYNKRLQEVVAPIYDDIAKFLDAYAKQRGISMIIDASKVPGVIFVTNNSMDITRDFIAEYNRRAATASTAPSR
ncbi:MAG: hypothetical protein C4334_10575 [Pyrinomonas sp.]|uniref:OmpH family outer membrane protein n=1 Tax=Pyrinomonas sp. TaxID=2080306 RepID=UPI00332E2C8D